MSVELQNEGTFRGLITEYGTREGSGPVHTDPAPRTQP